MPSRAARRPAGKPHTSQTARQTVASVFVQSLRAGKVSHASAAKGMRVTKRTVGAIARGETPLRLEAVMIHRKLWPHFARCLLVTERKARRV